MSKSGDSRNNQNHYNSKYYLALINYENEKFNQAIPLFLELLQNDSKNYELYNYLGNSYLKTNNLKLALSSFRQSLTLNSYDANIYYHIGLIY